MGLLGLRKFIDSCGCTRLLPVPVSDAEAEEEALRSLRLEGYHEVTGDEDNDEQTNAKTARGVYFEDSRRNERKDDRQRGLTSSTHANGSSAAAHATTTAVTPAVDHVLVDMNCIVHSCFHHQSSENKSKKQLIHEVLRRLRVLLTEVVVPRKSLSICFDGPAPIAKLQTQRLRRRKVSLLDTGGIQQLNTLSITPGSLFMIELENAIASQFKLNRGRGFLRWMCPVYLYGTTVMGEGEAKVSRALAFLAYGSTMGTETKGEREDEGGRSSTDRYVEVGGGHRCTPDGRCGGGGGDNNSKVHKARLNTSKTSASASSSSHPVNASAHYSPDDSIVVLGNDIDLVLTCLGATAYHNFSIISPSSLQLIRVSDIIYRWLKATSATRGDTPFTPAQLPSIRIDFIFLFLLNGGDHYAGAGEVAMPLWRRYRSVRATYPYSTLVSPNMDAIDIDFLADVVQAAEYTGSSSAEVGMNLLQSALWSLYTVVTGVCPDYNYVPEPEAPQLCHVRAAAAHCQRTNQRIRLADFNAQSRPLTPLETYVALMPTEATLPKSIAAGLHSRPAYQSILKVLETSNDTAMIAQAAKDAVEVSAPFLTTSEHYLRHFTSPVQLNVIPPRRRLSRYEQHRMLAKQGHIQVDDPVPIVAPIVMAEDVPYMEVPYPTQTSFLTFFCPFDVHTNAGEEVDDANKRDSTGNMTASLHGRTISTRPSFHATAVSTPDSHSNNSRTTNGLAVDKGIERRRVYLYQEEAAQMYQERERQSAAAKLQRTLRMTSNALQKGQHFTAPQERRMRRKLQRLKHAEEEELQSQLAKEDRKYAVKNSDDAGALQDELRRFLGKHASTADVDSLLRATTTEAGSTNSRSGGGGTASPQMKEKKARQRVAISLKKDDAKGTAKSMERFPTKKKQKRERDDSALMNSKGETSPSARGDGRQWTAKSLEYKQPLKKQKKQR